MRDRLTNKEEEEEEEKEWIFVRKTTTWKAFKQGNVDFGKGNFILFICYFNIYLILEILSFNGKLPFLGVFDKKRKSLFFLLS